MLLLAAWALAAADLDEELSGAVRASAAAAAPSVVRIETVGAAEPSGAVGAAVVAGADGWLFTSAHLVQPALAGVVAVLPDSRRFAATVRGTDRLRRIALLKIDVKGLAVATPAPAGAVKVGQYAVAIGRGWDAAKPNLGVGIVSATGRVWGRALQTDAKASPANYGGALVDLRGRVLGVLAPLTPDSDDTAAGLEWYDSGVGFAVPLDELLPLRPALEKGDLLAGLLGISFKDESLLAAPILGAAAWRSPAALAGWRAGDELASIDGAPIPRVGAARTALGRKHAGATVRVEVRRAGKIEPHTIALAGKLPTYRVPFAGAWFAGETPTLQYVAPGLPAAAALKAGDTLTTVAEKPVRNRADALAALQDFAPREKVRVAFRRGGKDESAELAAGEFPGAPPALPAPGVAAALPRSVGALPTPHWLLVPEGLRPADRPALLVWVDPAPPKPEDWAVACGRWRVAIVGSARPLPDAASWRELAKAAAARLGADPTRVVACGAGALAERLAAAEPAKFVAVAAFGGPLKLPPVSPGAPRRYALLGRNDDASLAAALGDAVERGLPALDLRGLPDAARAERLAAWTWWLAAW